MELNELIERLQVIAKAHPYRVEVLVCGAYGFATDLKEVKFNRAAVRGDDAGARPLVLLTGGEEE